MAAGLLASCDRSRDPGHDRKSRVAGSGTPGPGPATGRDAGRGESSGPASPPRNPPPALPIWTRRAAAYLGLRGEPRQNSPAAMPEAKFERTSVFPVEGPDPIQADLFAGRLPDHRQGRPQRRNGHSALRRHRRFLAGTRNGAKSSPSFKTKLAAATRWPANIAGTATGGSAKRTQPTDVMGANRTVEVQWNDDPSHSPPCSSPPPADNLPRTRRPKSGRAEKSHAHLA